jgi:hypothetical protein
MEINESLLFDFLIIGQGLKVCEFSNKNSIDDSNSDTWMTVTGYNVTPFTKILRGNLQN